MAYSETYGLIYFMSTSVKLPLKYIRFDTYQITPDQRTDKDSSINTSGKLIRHVLSHKRTKIEFNLRMMDSAMKTEFMNILRAAIGSDSSNKLQRKVQLKYWNDDLEIYSTGYFYVPDIEWKIRNIAENHTTHTGNIIYDETRIAFIEY